MPSKWFRFNRNQLWLIILLLVIVFVSLEYRLIVLVNVNNQHEDRSSFQKSDTIIIQQRAAKAVPPRTTNTNSGSHRNTTNTASTTPTIHPLCTKIPAGKSVESIWKQQFEAIYQASIHPDDSNRVHANWTKQLLTILHPSILKRSIRLLPNNYPTMERMFTQVYHQLNRNDGTRETTPIKIFVFGGSIVEGIGCDRWGRELQVPRKKRVNRMAHTIPSIRRCSWPFRLHHFLETLLGPSIIQVHNLAVGGTHSEAAVPVLRYWLSEVFPPSGPDIIVNAYSANDNLPPAFFSSHNTTQNPFHTYRIFQRNMDFVAAAFSSRPCQSSTSSTSSSSSTGRPFVWYINDYFGNQQESILGEGQVDEVIQQLALWHKNNLAYVSPASMVRLWVLANTSETVFSPKWTTKLGGPTINVHFGMSTHVVTMWTMAYSLLQTAVDFCDENRRRVWWYNKKQPRKKPPLSATTTVKITADTNADCNQQTPSLAHTTGSEFSELLQSSLHHTMTETPPDIFYVDLSGWESEQMRSPTEYVVPNMYVLSWNNISRRWKEMIDKNNQVEQAYCQSVTYQQYNSTGGQTSISIALNPCIFAFLAAPLGTHQAEGKLHQFLSPYVIGPFDQWLPQNNYRHGGFQNKLGLVAQHPNATITLGFHHITQPVKVVTIHYIKSYGPKWHNAKTKCTLEVFKKQKIISTTSFILEGFHSQNTSISYDFRLDLSKNHGDMAKVAPIGSSIRFNMELISGETFKINAMMFCSL